MRLRKKDAPAATEASQRDKLIHAEFSLSNSPINVNDYVLVLKDVHHRTGAMGKDIAAVVQDVFPKFTRQLLAQCENADKYGILLHPAALELICNAYKIELSPAEFSAEVSKEPKAKKQSKRKLPRKLTLRMTETDFERLQQRLHDDGFQTVQAWIYHTVIKALGVAE